MHAKRAYIIYMLAFIWLKKGLLLTSYSENYLRYVKILTEPKEQAEAEIIDDNQTMFRLANGLFSCS